MRVLTYKKTFISGPQRGKTVPAQMSCPAPRDERYAKKRLAMFTADSPATDLSGAAYTVSEIKFQKQRVTA